MRAKRPGGKRPGGKRLGGETTRGGNGLGAKRPGFVSIKHSLTGYEKNYPHNMVHVPCYLHQCQNVWIFTAGPDRCPNGLPM